MLAAHTYLCINISLKINRKTQTNRNTQERFLYNRPANEQMLKANSTKYNQYLLFRLIWCQNLAKIVSGSDIGIQIIKLPFRNGIALKDRMINSRSMDIFVSWDYDTALSSNCWACSSARWPLGALVAPRVTIAGIGSRRSLLLLSLVQ